MKKYFVIIILLISIHSFGQHEHNMNMQKDTMPMMNDSAMKMNDSNANMQNMDMNSMGMTHSFSLTLPMNRNGSGTSWMPDNSAMHMLMIMTKKGMWMFHGSIFLRYNNQQLTTSTSRSGSKFDAPNWVMAMYTKQVGTKGLFHFSSMLSADAFSVGKNGYPLLFQSGESYNGKPLVDRQHPHDLFSELSVAYTQRISNKTDVYAYFGYPGEPALGPPAFMHRVSAMNIPDAPISHHWQDATHITFGVATVGLRLNKMKIEFSKFNGREPDENRYNFDAIKFNSYSYRLSYNPNKAWALQFSQGYIKSPEALNPSENIWRYTASALYATPVNKGKSFSSAFVWGMNDAGSNHREHSILLEAAQQFSKQALYGKYEFVQKSSEELVIANLYGDTFFNIHTITIGTNRKLFSAGKIDFLSGTQLIINIPPATLKNLYGSAPMSGEIYFQIRPH